MAVISPGPFLQAGSHTAQAARQLLSALVGQDVETFAGGVGASGPGHGVVRSGHLAVSQNGSPNMSVNVAAGIALITGTSSLAQGVYVFTNDATTNLAIATADATNPRWDLVVAQVRDNDEDAGGFDDMRLHVVTGTPAASPADPVVPAGCLVLGRVVVAALATSITNANITDLRTRCSSPGSSWQAYTPSLTGVTLGSGTLNFRYRRSGPTTCHVRGTLTLASGSSITGLIGFGYPSGISPVLSPVSLGNTWYVDANSTDFVGSCRAASIIACYAATTVAATSATVPFTWATGDQVEVDIQFEMSG